MKRHLFGVAAAVLGTILVGGVALQTTVAAAPLPTTVTLPLFGPALTIDITTDAGGALTDVAVDFANPTVVTKLKPHKVVFQAANTDPLGDPARIVIKSGHGGQSVSARAGSLADVSGPGKWSGDVFGTGVASTVSFTVGEAATGGPDITVGATTGEAAVVGATEYSSGDGHEGDDESSQSARAKITFTSATGDQTRVLSIRVKVETESDDDDDDDGGTSAKLSISLGKIRGVAVDAAAAVGPHTWSGTLCDDTAATINYTVALDGTVSAVTATPDTAVVSFDGGKISVKFSDHEKVKIRVHEEDGMIKIQSSIKFRCNSGDPTFNGVAVSIPDTGGDHHDGDGDHKGSDGHHHGD